jgi:hypothetical protein
MEVCGAEVGRVSLDSRSTEAPHRFWRAEVKEVQIKNIVYDMLREARENQAAPMAQPLHVVGRCGYCAGVVVVGRQIHTDFGTPPTLDAYCEKCKAIPQPMKMRERRGADRRGADAPAARKLTTEELRRGRR